MSEEGRGSELEYVRKAKLKVENINGVSVVSFEVPYIRYFADEELVYLEALLNFKNDEELIKKIDENKLGRKAIEKVFAYRLKRSNNIPEPWPIEPVLLPSLIQNEDTEPKPMYESNSSSEVIEGISSAYGLNKFEFSYTVRINGIENFLFMGVVNKGFYREVYIMRNVEPMAIVKYNIYT